MSCHPLRTNRSNRRVGTRRRGVVAVEGAITLLGLLLMLFFLIDMGLAVIRYNMLGVAARAVARQAVVCGSTAAPDVTVWGPTAVTTTAAASNKPAACVAPLAATMNPADVNIQIEWLDGDNDPGSRVRVTLTYQNVAVAPLFDLNANYALRAVSVMQIVH